MKIRKPKDFKVGGYDVATIQHDSINDVGFNYILCVASFRTNSEKQLKRFNQYLDRVIKFLEQEKRRRRK